jgi:hypothetical protein
MPRVSINCWNEQCSTGFIVDCGNTDKALYCTRCSQAITFVNLGYVVCRACVKRIPITVRYGIPLQGAFHCEECNTPFTISTVNSGLRIFSFEQIVKNRGQYPYLGYCGRDSFEGLENEVQIARAALDRVCSGGRNWKLFGRLSALPKKTVFIRRLEPMSLPGQSLPVDFIQAYHAYCNFKARPSHKNAKWSGTLGQFARGPELDDIIKPGMAEIWFDDERTKSEFESVPPLSKYAAMFRVI